jgi:plastocyanin
MTSTTPRAKALGIGAVSVLVATAALVFAVMAQAAPTKLMGTVGPGATISLKTTTGKRVSVLPRGSYQIVVRDRSDDHNFAMRGPGVNRTLTGVDFVGTKTVTVKLGAGRYSFVCTPHSDEMRGSFGIR